MTNVLSSNGNGWQTLSMFCDLMFSSPFPEDLGSGAASSSPFTMEIWHPIGSPYPATSQNISRGGWMMGIDGAYPLIRLAFTKNSGLRINRSMIFTIPGKNRCTEAGIHIYIYPQGNQLRLPLSLVLGVGQVQSHTELQEDASIRKCKAGINSTTINNISILS